MKHLTNLCINDHVSEPGNANSEPMGAQHRAAGVGSAPYLCQAQMLSHPSRGCGDGGHLLGHSLSNAACTQCHFPNARGSNCSQLLLKL